MERTRYNQRPMPSVGVAYTPQYNPEFFQAASQMLQQSQQQHDGAVAAQAQEMAARNEIQALDVDMKNQVMGQYKDDLKAIIDSYGGDVGAARNKLVERMGTESSNPFWGANKYQMEQAKVAQQIELQHGPQNTIWVNDPRSPEALRAAMASGDLSNLDASGAKRDNYIGIMQDLGKDIEPKIKALALKSAGLREFLQYGSSEKLTESDLQALSDIMVDPFLAAAGSTRFEDPNGAYGWTKTPEGIAKMMQQVWSGKLTDNEKLSYVARPTGSKRGSETDAPNTPFDTREYPSVIEGDLAARQEYYDNINRYLDVPHDVHTGAKLDAVRSAAGAYVNNWGVHELGKFLTNTPRTSETTKRRVLANSLFLHKEIYGGEEDGMYANGDPWNVTVGNRATGITTIDSETEFNDYIDNELSTGKELPEIMANVNFEWNNASYASKVAKDLVGSEIDTKKSAQIAKDIDNMRNSPIFKNLTDGGMTEREAVQAMQELDIESTRVHYTGYIVPDNSAVERSVKTNITQMVTDKIKTTEIIDGKYATSNNEMLGDVINTAKEIYSGDLMIAKGQLMVSLKDEDDKTRTIVVPKEAFPKTQRDALGSMQDFLSELRDFTKMESGTYQITGQQGNHSFRFTREVVRDENNEPRVETTIYAALPYGVTNDEGEIVDVKWREGKISDRDMGMTDIIGNFNNYMLAAMGYSVKINPVKVNN